MCVYAKFLLLVKSLDSVERYASVHQKNPGVFIQYKPFCDQHCYFNILTEGCIYLKPCDVL